MLECGGAHKHACVTTLFAPLTPPSPAPTAMLALVPLAAPLSLLYWRQARSRDEPVCVAAGQRPSRSKPILLPRPIPEAVFIPFVISDWPGRRSSGPGEALSQAWPPPTT